MEDFQFWLYLLFAIIYIVSRALKKKRTDETPPRPNAEPAEGPRSGNKPPTFEELLREFTQGKEPEERSIEKEPDYERTIEKEPKVRKKEAVEQEFEEGVTRRFSDEESKRVYEESVKRAEGAILEFKQDEKFKSTIQRRDRTQGRSSAAAKEIKAMLQDSSDAKKAIILSEILNRKY